MRKETALRKCRKIFRIKRSEVQLTKTRSVCYTTCTKTKENEVHMNIAIDIDEAINSNQGK